MEKKKYFTDSESVINKVKRLNNTDFNYFDELEENVFIKIREKQIHLFNINHAFGFVFSLIVVAATILTFNLVEETLRNDNFISKKEALNSFNDYIFYPTYDNLNELDTDQIDNKLVSGYEDVYVENYSNTYDYDYSIQLNELDENQVELLYQNLTMK